MNEKPKKLFLPKSDLIIVAVVLRVAGVVHIYQK